jgi:hypothetical protein
VNCEPVVERHAIGDAVRNQQRHRHNDASEQHHQESEAVHPNEILHAERRNPLVLLDELQRPAGGIKRLPQPKRQCERQKAESQRKAPRQLFVLQADDDDAADEGSSVSSVRMAIRSLATSPDQEQHQTTSATPMTRR